MPASKAGDAASNAAVSADLPSAVRQGANNAGSQRSTAAASDWETRAHQPTNHVKSQAPRWESALLFALLALTALIRLPGIDRPLLGNFATKNVVYAMIARNWALGRADVARPTLDLLSGGERAWHLVEWPASAYVTGSLWKLCGGSLDAWGRSTAIAWSVLAVALLFLLVRRWHGSAAAWGAAVVYSLSPVSIIYGQSFMLEASVGCLTIASFWALQRWLDKRRMAWLFVATVCLALLFLTKIYMLVLLLPLLFLASRENGSETAAFPRRQRLCLFAAATLFALLPATLWYANTWQVSAPGCETATRIYYSLRQSSGVHRFPSSLLAQPDFYRQLLDDLSGVTLTPVGLMLAALALSQRNWRRHLPWLAAMALLVAALPLKFYEMNYYQLVVLPPLAVLAGLGWQRLQSKFAPGGAAIAGVLLLGFVFSARFAARPAFATPNEDCRVLAAAAALQPHVPPGEPVIAIHGSTIDLLYYCDRPGWSLSLDDPDFVGRLADCRLAGATHLVVCEQAARLQALQAVFDELPLTLVASSGDFRVYRFSRQE